MGFLNVMDQLQMGSIENIKMRVKIKKKKKANLLNLNLVWVINYKTSKNQYDDLFV